MECKSREHPPPLPVPHMIGDTVLYEGYLPRGKYGRDRGVLGDRGGMGTRGRYRAVGAVPRRREGAEPPRGYRAGEDVPGERGGTYLEVSMGGGVGYR